MCEWGGGERKREGRGMSGGGGRCVNRCNELVKCRHCESFSLASCYGVYCSYICVVSILSVKKLWVRQCHAAYCSLCYISGPILGCCIPFKC